MTGKVFFTLCALGLLSQVYSHELTKEFDVGQYRHNTFQDVIDQIKSTNIPAEAIKFVFPKAEETSSTLTDLLTKSDVGVPEILDVFNRNFGVQLIVVKDDFIQIDLTAYQMLLSNKAMSVVKSVYPNNFFDQLALYGVLQKQILLSMQTIGPVIDNSKIPLGKITSLMASGGHNIAKRDEDFTKSLLSTVELALCNTIVDAAYSTLNETLTSVESYLSDISVSGSNTLLTSLVTLGIEVVEELIEGLNVLAEAFTESICSQIFGSRKRRDVENFELTELGRSDIATRSLISNLFDLVWSLVASVMNPILTSLANSTISYVKSYIDSFLEVTFTDWIYSIIDSIF